MSKNQRTKGGVKPASSARAAEQLLARGEAIPFAGFDGGLTNQFLAASREEPTPLDNIDGEVQVVFKKFLKKDPLSREKAIRELLQLLPTKSQEVTEGAMHYFSSIYERMSLDGSIQVRACTARLGSYFIASLKKSAQKYIKPILAHALFSESDPSSAVSAAARSLIEDNFADEKKAKVISQFGPLSIEMALEILRGTSALIPAQKFDEEETAEQRRSRLQQQAIQCLLSLNPRLDSTAVQDQIREFLHDKVSLKKLLQPGNNVTTGLALLANSVFRTSPSSLVGSPLLPVLLDSLASSDLALCRSAFDVFVLVASVDGFYETFNLRKAIVPKLLHVLRKKQSHWRAIAPYLLPSLALVSSRLETDAPTFVLSFLTSFFDGLPFESDVYLPLWTKAFVECTKYALTKASSRDEVASILPLTHRALAVCMERSEEAQSELSAFFLWIVEKDLLDEALLADLLESLALNLINKLPSSSSFLGRLVSPPCHPKFKSLQQAVIVSSATPASLLSILLSDPSTFTTSDVADVLSQRVAKKEDVILLIPAIISSLKKGIKLKEELPWEDMGFSGTFFRRVLDEDPSLLELSLGDTWVHVAENVLLTWAAERNPESEEVEKALARDAVALIELIQRRGGKNIVKELALRRNLDLVFLSRLVLKLQVDDGRLLVEAVLDEVFQRTANLDTPDSKELTHILKAASSTPPGDSFFDKFYLHLMEVQLTLHGIEAMVNLANELLSTSSGFEGFLMNGIRLRAFLESLDSQLAAEAMLETRLFSPLTSAKAMPSSLLAASQCGLFLSLLSKLTLSETSLAAVAACHATTILLHSTQFAFEPLGEVAISFIEKSKAFIASLATRCAAARSLLLVSSTQPSRVGLLTLTQLADEGVRLGNIGDLAESLSTSEIRVALGMYTEKSSKDWVCEFASCRGAESLNEVLKEFIKESSGNDSLFTFSNNAEEWRLNIAVIEAGRIAVAKASAEVVDFISCGLITAMTSADEGDRQSGEWRLFASAAVRLFTSCDDFFSSAECKDFREEWNEFFAPSAREFLYKWFLELDSESIYDHFTRSLCSAVLSREFPADLSSLSTKTQLDPLLDSLGYPPQLQGVIMSVSRMIHSSIPHIRFVALRLWKKLTEIMFEVENAAFISTQGGKEKEGEEVFDIQERRPVVPQALCFESSSNWPSVFALDAAISVIESTSSLSLRAAYCNCISKLVAHSLPIVLSLCPKWIDNSNEQTFFLLDPPMSSPLTVDAYCCRLVFRTVSLLPAVVRIWYNSLPRGIASEVNSFMREYVSPLLLAREFDAIDEAEINVDRLKIRRSRGAREVMAEYSMEDSRMELTITLPPDFPLSVPTPKLSKGIGSQDMVRRWLLQLTSFLFNQNGRLVDGILQWKRSVDKSIEGVDECTVCMAAVSSVNYQLPKAKCRQCKKKFHSSCLYKWFETSNQMTCPLCRANFA